jgi:S1-C subfamily serine protease
MSAGHFRFQLDAVQDVVPANTTAAPLISTSVTNWPESASVEDVVGQALPAVVRVSTSGEAEAASSLRLTASSRMRMSCEGNQAQP